MSLLHVQQMRCPVQDDRFRLGHPLLDLVMTLHIELLALAAQHEQHRLRDVLSLLIGKVPRFVGGRFDAEVGVQIPQRLLQTTRDASGQGGPLGGTAEERVRSGFPVALPVALSGRDVQLAHGFPARNRGQGSFQQDERVDVRWSVEGELQGNCSAKGVADYVRPGQVQVLKQCPGVGCLVLDAHRPPRGRALQEASAVVPDECVVL